MVKKVATFLLRVPVRYKSLIMTFESSAHVTLVGGPVV